MFSVDATVALQQAGQVKHIRVCCTFDAICLLGEHSGWDCGQRNRMVLGDGGVAKDTQTRTMCVGAWGGSRRARQGQGLHRVGMPLGTCAHALCPCCTCSGMHIAYI